MPVYMLVITFVCCGQPPTVELCPCTPSFGTVAMPETFVRCDGQSIWSKPTPACPIRYFASRSSCQAAGAVMRGGAITSFQCQKLDKNELVPN
jgi:hypothetical protein